MGFFDSLFGGGGGGISADKSSTSTTSVSTNDNRRTVAGEGINTEGDNNTTVIERADAGVLNSVAGVLGDMSFDLSQNIGTGFNSVKGLADVNAASNAAFLAALTANRDAELKSNAQSIRELADGFTAAKTADSAQVNQLAENGLKAGVIVAALGLLALLARKKS